jgi:hypothetical protein
MNKAWSLLLYVSPWFLLLLPIQLLLIELTTTPYLGLGQLILAFVLILYRTSHPNELIIRSCVVLGYSLLLGIIAQTKDYELHTYQHAMWVVMLVYMVALTRRERTTDTTPLRIENTGLDWRFISAVLGVVAVSVGLRMTNIHVLPVFGGDEANAALYGIAVRDGIIKNLFASGWYEFPALWFVIPALTHTLLPDGMLAVRIHSIIIGSLSSAALIWALRSILPLWFAASAGVVLAFFGAHIFFSQIGLNNIYDGFFLVLMVGLLVRQHERIVMARWGLLGLVIGLSLYGYTSARLLPVIFGVWVVMMLWHDKDQWRAYSRGFVLVALIAGVVAAPLLVHYFYRPDNMVAPMVRTSFFSTNAEGLSLFARIERDSGRSIWIQLWAHFVASVSALTIANSTGWYRFSGGLGGSIMVIPFVIGVGYAVISRAAIVMRLAVIAVLLFLVMSMLSHPVGSGQRLVTALPLVAMLSAYGLLAINQLLRRYLPAWQAMLVVVAVLSLSSYTNYDAYFRQFLLYEGGVGDANSRVADFFGQLARRLPAGTVVDVYPSGDFQQNVNASIIYNARHLDYREVSAEKPARSSAQVIVVPIGSTVTVDIPPAFVRSTFVAKSSDDILMTIAYHPTLQPYFADMRVDRTYPPRFGLIPREEPHHCRPSTGGDRGDNISTNFATFAGAAMAYRFVANPAFVDGFVGALVARVCR